MLHSASPLLDAQVLLSFALKQNREYLLLYPQREISPACCKDFFDFIAQRQTGLQVAYITGYKEFYGRDFAITQDVLVPKPDTETLVETVINYIKQNDLYGNMPLALCDICTGSGCVAISLYKELCPPFSIKITATDISKKALDIARVNSISYTNDAIVLRQMDLMAGFNKDELFDIIVSNPPYVPYSIAQELLKDGRGEPLLALCGNCENTTGLSLVSKLVPQAFMHLKRGGALFMELGEYNINEAATLMSNAHFSNIKIINDLAMSPRVLQGQKI